MQNTTIYVYDFIPPLHQFTWKKLILTMLKENILTMKLTILIAFPLFKKKESK